MPASVASGGDLSNCKKAVQAYRQVLAIRPLDVASRLSLAQCLYAAGEQDEAVREYKRASQISGFKEELQARIMALDLVRERSDLTLSKTAAERDILDGSVHYALANELTLKGLKTEALMEYCLAVANRQPDLRAYREIGSMLAESASYLMASNALRRYIAHAEAALDVPTISVKLATIEVRHGPKIVAELAELERGGRMKISTKLLAGGPQ